LYSTNVEKTLAFFIYKDEGAGAEWLLAILVKQG
jgi:hypothetical protein